MKSIRFIVLLLLTAIISCTDDVTPDENIALGPIQQVNEYYDGRLAITYDLFYDSTDQLDSVNVVTDISMITGVKMIYDDYDVARINFTLLRNGFTIEYAYDVLQFTDETIAIDRQSNRTIVFKTTEGYVDSYRIFITTDPEFMTEGIFIRDAEQNIKSISFYESNGIDNDFFIYEYTFSDFDTESNIPAIFNPVYDRSFFDFRLVFYLGLKLSKGTPLVSSYRDGAGTFIQDNIKAEIIDKENGVVKRLSQTRQDIPDVLTEIEFIF